MTCSGNIGVFHSPYVLEFFEQEQNREDSNNQEKNFLIKFWCNGLVAIQNFQIFM